MAFLFLSRSSSFYFFIYIYCVLSYSAEALQSIIRLMGAQSLKAMFSGNAKVQHVDWTQEAAKEVLQAWQRNFTKVCFTEF